MTVLASQGRQGSLPVGMPEEALTYRWFAKAYGWTPGQVDALTLDQQRWIPIVEEAHGRVEEMRARDERNAGGGPKR